MATSIARRSTFLFAMMKSAMNSSSRFPGSAASSARSNTMFRDTHKSLSPSRMLRRELSSLLPAHSAVALACLVSKISSEANTSMEGRFANYLSPI